MPEVSVIMPVYNGGSFLGPAIESVLSQTFTDFEFLIFDDGSTDGSIETARRYAAADPRITFVAGEHRGYTWWLNQGLERGSSPLVGRMDADDLSMPPRLQRQVEFLARHPDIVAVGCGVELIDDSGNTIGSKPRPETHAEIDAQHLRGVGGAIEHPTVVMRRQALTTIGGYRTEFEPAEDFDLFLRLAEVGQLANVAECLFKYRIHKGAVSIRRMELDAVRANSALREALERRGLPVPEHLRQGLDATIARHVIDGYLWRVELLARNRHFSSAHEILDEAMRYATSRKMGSRARSEIHRARGRMYRDAGRTGLTVLTSARAWLLQHLS